MSLKIRHTIASLFVSSLLMSFKGGESGNRPFTIVTTTNIIADVVKHIVKEDAQVISLMGVGVDPHTYRMTQEDLEHLKYGDVIFYNGLGLEGKMDGVFKILSKSRKVYACSDAIRNDQLIMEQDYGIAVVDPHIWFDVQLWQQVAVFIGDKLQQARPQRVDVYKRNTADYVNMLKDLHANMVQKISTIPKEQRVLVTTHDAFSYFGRAYGIEIVPLQGISTAAECGLKSIRDLVDTIVKYNIKAVFLESAVSNKAMYAVLEGCKAKGCVVQLGGTLYTDTLGAPNSDAGTYCGMMQANVNTMVEALA